jgi:endonuclease/exonuclease/phosphatase family metal-dependent hydrolase
MPKFQAYGMTDEPAGKHRLNSIFVRQDRRFSVVSSGGFWLSETPHVPGSKSWDSCCVRFANWLRLEDAESGTEFRILNTHLDHVGQAAREGQARLLAEDSLAYPPDYPQILTGDFNCVKQNPALRILLESGWMDTCPTTPGERPEGPGTFHGFAGDRKDLYGKIDFILVRGKVVPTQTEIIRDRSPEGQYPSDHFFLQARLRIP